MQDHPQMTERQPLYNSRLIKMNIEYVRLNYPQLHIESILEQAGIAPYQIEDHAHWFTQEEVDFFHDVLLRVTGNPTISYDVGKFAASSQSWEPPNSTFSG